MKEAKEKENKLTGRRADAGTPPPVIQLRAIIRAMEGGTKATRKQIESARANLDALEAAAHVQALEADNLEAQRDAHRAETARLDKTLTEKHAYMKLESDLSSERTRRASESEALEALHREYREALDALESQKEETARAQQERDSALDTMKILTTCNTTNKIELKEWKRRAEIYEETARAETTRSACILDRCDRLTAERDEYAQEATRQTRRAVEARAKLAAIAAEIITTRGDLDRMTASYNNANARKICAMEELEKAQRATRAERQDHETTRAALQTVREIAIEAADRAQIPATSQTGDLIRELATGLIDWKREATARAVAMQEARGIAQQPQSPQERKVCSMMISALDINTTGREI